MLVTRTEDSPLCLLQRMVLSSQQPVTSSDIFGIGYTTMVRFVCMALTNNWLTMACFSTIIPEHYDYHVNIDGYYTNNNLFFSFIFYLFLLLPLLSVNTRSAKPPSTIADSASDLTRKCPTSPGSSTVASGSLVYILLSLFRTLPCLELFVARAKQPALDCPRRNRSMCLVCT